MQVLLDAAVIVVSYIFAWYIRFRSGLFALDEWYLSRQSYMKLLYVIVPVFLILRSVCMFRSGSWDGVWRHGACCRRM